MKNELEQELIRQWQAGPEHRRALIAAAVYCLTEHREEAKNLQTQFPRKVWLEALRRARAQKDAETWCLVADFIEHDILKGGEQ